MKKRFIALTATLAVVGALCSVLPIARAQSAPPAGAEAPKPHKGERHPAIHHAITALEEAKRDMQHADHDFGGHRKEALEECDRAIAQLKLALQYDKK